MRWSLSGSLNAKASFAFAALRGRSNLVLVIFRIGFAAVVLLAGLFVLRQRSAA